MSASEAPPWDMSSTDRHTTVTRPLHIRYVRYTPSSTRSVAILAGPLGPWARFLFFVLTRPPARSETPDPPLTENSISLRPIGLKDISRPPLDPA